MRIDRLGKVGEIDPTDTKTPDVEKLIPWLLSLSV
jgi:hypothetical protein